MAVTVRDLIIVLETFFPGHLSLHQALYVLVLMGSLFPLLRLHQTQRRQPRQPRETAWMKTITQTLRDALYTEDPLLTFDEASTISTKLAHDFEAILEFIGLGAPIPHHPPSLVPRAKIILCSTYTTCIRCPPGLHPQSLCRREKLQEVRVLDADFTWQDAYLFVAHCPACKTDYLPDKIMFKPVGDQPKMQTLIFDPPFLRVSKHGIWVHRKIAMSQERALVHFHAGWANFTAWMNETIKGDTSLTNRQTQRLFLEHFARRLLLAHHVLNFRCAANPNSADFAAYVRDAIGKDGGVIASSMEHACINCLHRKRYRVDLVSEGMEFDGEDNRVIGLDADLEVPGEDDLGPGDLPPGLRLQPVNQEHVPNGPRGYVRMAVMDGKTICHRICAIGECRKPLVNYKDGRFCRDHLGMHNICGIIPCGEPVRSAGALICNSPEHIAWHNKYAARFSRLSYPGVRRVVRRQNERRENGESSIGPQLDVRLPDLGDTASEDVVHTFRARSCYCLQTVQWACGVPIGWGKCYRSESPSQVLKILDTIWANFPGSKPSFIAYDNACNLLRHIVTQDDENPWLTSTKFIVDAWHYIGHQASDILCRIWCNPAPANGSQPDLLIVQEDNNGNKHTTRAFNTETAEQLNSWLDGFEAQLRQMTDVNYDFYVHVWFMLYKEAVEERIQSKGQSLPDDFWDV
ncbi:hypothetical protein HGRIS_014636 [Hohenbuehelia grisea]|uniref:CxC5 like cysteine cluster associated with KDZ domain-containing protein n=1 Tax=Hohenbuehelia grisea TaxID=104357 RepID=A0ABR3JVH3_9AGAR